MKPTNRYFKVTFEDGSSSIVHDYSFSYLMAMIADKSVIVKKMTETEVDRIGGVLELPTIVK